MTADAHYDPERPPQERVDRVQAVLENQVEHISGRLDAIEDRLAEWERWFSQMPVGGGIRGG